MKNKDKIESKPLFSDNTKDRAKFLLGAVLFSPLCASEDLLRLAGANIHQKGLMYNGDGKSMMEIWRESKPRSEDLGNI